MAIVTGTNYRMATKAVHLSMPSFINGFSDGDCVHVVDMCTVYHMSTSNSNIYTRHSSAVLEHCVLSSKLFIHTYIQCTCTICPAEHMLFSVCVIPRVYVLHPVSVPVLHVSMIHLYFDRTVVSD